jgi:hypothetical protein
MDQTTLSNTLRATAVSQKEPPMRNRQAREESPLPHLLPEGEGKDRSLLITNKRKKKIGL